MRLLPFLPLCLATIAGACAPDPGHFSEPNAAAHIRKLAGEIGSRPVGTHANARARAYLVEQLELYGFDVRVQETDAVRPEAGTTARLVNIIGVRPGRRREAIGLVAHYDSVPESPGATDDGLGTAVVLESARLLAARAQPNYSLIVLLTDGEEANLMGAAALVTDRDVAERLQAYINVESIGSAGQSILFETGPGNRWILDAWTSAVPKPRGSSYALEIYERLPNDTDFSILKQTGAPGFNFAPIGDSYAYHTPRDVPERLSTATLLHTGQTVVALAGALDAMDLTRRSAEPATFFDAASIGAVAYGVRTARLLTIVAVLAGAIGGVRVIVAFVRGAGLVSLLLTILWAKLGAAAVCGAMVGATWMLRAVREVYHPWYAHPTRLFLLLIASGVTAGWLVSRAGAWLPARARGAGTPLAVWLLTLPVWTGLAIVFAWRAPSAAHLWIIPLLTAGALLAVMPLTSTLAIRIVSIVVLAVSGTLWIRDTGALLAFAVPALGRMPFVTPVFAFAALMILAGVMVVPPLLGVLASTRTSRRSLVIVTGLLLVSVAVTLGWAYAAPAYTYERPQRRYVRYVEDRTSGRAFWETGGNEPGLDLLSDAPGTWRPVRDAPPLSVVSRPLPHPFVFRNEVPPGPSEPGSVSARAVRGLWAIDVEIVAVPREPGGTVAFVFPPGVVPLQSNLAGIVRQGTWTASYVAPPAAGIAFRGTFKAADAARLGGARVAFRDSRLPGGTGWQGLPRWLPQDRAVWETSATYLVPVKLD